MFYEEEVINGVLSWRTKQDGKWTALAPEMLTIRLQNWKREAEDCRAELIEAEDKLKRIREVLGEE